jgi:hypothetical protein
LVDGGRTTITRVVLGQPGDDRIEAGLATAAAIVDRVTGQRVAREHGPRTLPPLGAPGSHG